MLFIGAGGLAAQIFEDILLMKLQKVVFWSEIETDNIFVKENFRIISTDDEVIEHFNTISKDFVLCIGDVNHRKKLAERFIKLGGNPVSFISPKSTCSPYVKSIGKGSLILGDVSIEPGVIVGEFCLLNRYAIFGHGCNIGSYSTIGPRVSVCGNVDIGENCLIGIGTVIIEKIRIGNNVIIAAGAAVTKNIPDNAVVEGVPARIRFYRKNESKHLHNYV